MTYEAVPAPEPYQGDGRIKWVPDIDLGSGERIALRGDLAEGDTLLITNLPDRDDFTVRVVGVVDNKDGTVTVTTEPVEDGWQPAAFELYRD